MALSFSTAFPRRQIAPTLEKLRQLLPEHIALWTGGQGMLAHTSNPAFSVHLKFAEALAGIAEWRIARSPP